MQKLKLEELNRMSEEEFKRSNKNPVILVLDNVRSLNNVGSAFRTADAFRVEKIFLCGITGIPPHREIQKTALGATESVSWEYKEDVPQVLQELKNVGWKIYCLEQTDASIKLQDFTPQSDEKYVFVFGNEISGVSEAALFIANACLEIPQFGTKHSINISVSLGIVCWHYSCAMLHAGKFPV